MVITILEARVDADKHDILRAAYGKRTEIVPESIIRTFLVQDTGHADVWQIITIWRSAADLQAMRSSGETPTGVLIFNEAGARPNLTIWDVKEAAPTSD